MKNVNTPYDDVFRTLLNDCRQLVIPLINELFGENYNKETTVITLQNEHFMRKQDNADEERITDSCLYIQGKRYHIECQSTPDGSMIVRMFEYDSQIALENRKIQENVMEVEFPESALLYLRSTQTTPDNMSIIVKNQEKSMSYHIPVLKIRDYNLEDIFRKELYFLLPFYLFTFENRFDKIETDEIELEKLKKEYITIGRKLDELTDCGKISEFTKASIVEMVRKVSEHLAQKYVHIQKGVEEAMGGKILNYRAKEILYEGIQEGIREGIQRGGMLCYLNAVSRGMQHEEAIAIAGITKQDADRAILLRKDGKL